jgi:hypothetical protein
VTDDFRSTHMARDFAEMAFGLTDITASFWKPLMKGVGRYHLEMSALNARNTQAVMTWAQSVSGALNPIDVLNANMQLGAAIVRNASETLPRVAGALSQAAEPVLPVQVIPLPLVPRRAVEPSHQPHGEDERRVA